MKCLLLCSHCARSREAARFGYGVALCYECAAQLYRLKRN